MFDTVQTQYDLRDLLLSEELLSQVQIKSHRVMVIESELDYRVLLTTPRNGRMGAGIIVLQPVAKGRNRGVSGPVLDWTFPVVVIEMPTINMHKTAGTLMSAEDIAQKVLEVMQLYADELRGTFQIESAAIAPETEYVFKGCVSYRVSFGITGRSLQRERVNVIQLTYDSNAGTVTLSCPTAGVLIRYTTNGTFPAKDQSINPSAVDYTGPFPVNSGDKVRAVAYKSGMNNSPARYLSVP